MKEIHMIILIMMTMRKSRFDLLKAAEPRPGCDCVFEVAQRNE